MNVQLITSHIMNKLPEAKYLAKRLIIREENIKESKNNIWDFSLRLVTQV